MTSTVATIESRLRAKELIELAGNESPDFWRRLAELAAEKVGMVVTAPTHSPDLDAMTDDQASAFERQQMPFGKHAGTPIYDLETSYLCSVSDPSPFMKEFKRYTRWRCKVEPDHVEDRDEL